MKFYKELLLKDTNETVGILATTVRDFAQYLPWVDREYWQRTKDNKLKRDDTTVQVGDLITVVSKGAFPTTRVNPRLFVGGLRKESWPVKRIFVFGKMRNVRMQP